MNGFSLDQFAPEPELDVTDEATYQALLADGAELPEVLDEDQAIIDALIQQQQMRMQATLAFQQRAEQMNRLARMTHERALYGTGQAY